jgi:hypothetical protein
MKVFRNTHPNWLKDLLKNGHSQASGKRFISFSLDIESGGQDDFGDTTIIFDREILDNQGLEEIYYEKDYFEENPEISQYVTGYESEQDYYDGQDFDNAEEAAEQFEMDWENTIESYEHEKELVIKRVEYKNGLIEKVIFTFEPDEELKSLLEREQIEYVVFPKGSLKSFENYNPDLEEKAAMSGIGCTLNDNGEYDCNGNIILNSMYVRDGKIIVQFGHINGHFTCSDLGLTTLEGCPRVVGYFDCSENQLTDLKGGPESVAGDYMCYSNKLTSLEGAPKKIRSNFDCSDNLTLTTLEGGPEEMYSGKKYDASMTSITDLKGLPKKAGEIHIKDCKDLETFHNGPESINITNTFDSIKSEKVSKTEYKIWQRLLIGGVLNNETYFKDVFGLMVAEDNLEEIHKIKWPQEIIDIMPEKIKNLYMSKRAGRKFNIVEYYNVLRFEEFVNEGLDRYYGKLDLSENIKTDTTELLSSIDLKEVDLYKTLNLLVDDVNLEGMTIEQLADNSHFLSALEKLSLKKEEPQTTADSDTFLTSSLTFMGIYPIQVLEIQDPEYLLVQIGNGPIKLYKVSGSIKDFYDKLTSKTVEITAGDKKWIYKTSNSGNNWDLQGSEEPNDVFKDVMTTQELEDSLNSNTKIEVIS